MSRTALNLAFGTLRSLVDTRALSAETLPVPIWISALFSIAEMNLNCFARFWLASKQRPGRQEMLVPR